MEPGTMRSSAKTLLAALATGLAATLPAAAQEKTDQAAFEVSEVTGEVLPLVEVPLPPIRRETYASLAAPAAVAIRRPIVRTRIVVGPRSTGTTLRCTAITCPHLMLIGTAF